jgi:hypothetical protein
MLKFSLPGVLLCLPLAAGIMLQGGSCNDSKSNKNVSNMNQAQNSNAPVAQKKLTGEWGGQGISMVVTEAGATLDFDCATGTITEVIVPDSDGKFSVKGLFARQRPGPTREGDDNEGQPAVYSGAVEGENLTLTITLERNNEKAGTFKLVHGKPARIRRCA